MAQTSGWVLCFAGDSLDESRTYRTKCAALDAFKETAQELALIGQPIEATVHAKTHYDWNDNDCVCEYPDFALSLGPRGGVRCESV
jgi:hypothetical protein